mmetsp:Transcript_42453/g.100970  ORF Transcript_42453/g.100970 Transcript_42453/m.100970 type:complete len:251 (-) Transcript_42453:119-871(-)
MSAVSILCSSASSVTTGMGASGSALAICATAAAESAPSAGNSTSNLMYSFPFTNGFLCIGMPSLSMAFTSPGRIISPGLVLTMIWRASRWSMAMVAPHSASESVIFSCRSRSSPLRMNLACSVCWITKTTSPGSVPGCWSASPEKTIFCPCFMPLSMLTSRTLRWLATFLPLQGLQRSPALIDCPVPWQSPQCVCICWIMPGAIWRETSLMPCPWHPPHVVLAPGVFEPLPLQVSQMTFRESASFDVLPL